MGMTYYNNEDFRAVLKEIADLKKRVEELEVAREVEITAYQRLEKKVKFTEDELARQFKKKLELEKRIEELEKKTETPADKWKKEVDEYLKSKR